MSFGSRGVSQYSGYTDYLRTGCAQPKIALLNPEQPQKTGLRAFVLKLVLLYCWPLTDNDYHICLDPYHKKIHLHFLVFRNGMKKVEVYRNITISLGDILPWLIRDVAGRSIWTMSLSYYMITLRLKPQHDLLVVIFITIVNSTNCSTSVLLVSRLSSLCRPQPLQDSKAILFLFGDTLTPRLGGAWRAGFVSSHVLSIAWLPFPQRSHPPTLFSYEPIPETAFLWLPFH